MRGIVGYIFFFTCGLIAAGAYFYQLHPEHSIDDDLPRMRRGVDDAVERGKRMREAWDLPERQKDAPQESASQK
ncbi:MAG: hypothetical protein KF696_03900 [Planctomycetes bacterium]|nr:hypothetical protein [Planctomycetota bacterium]MCW8134114.1 hypothetical protein [Planctomycetota bacterium]